MKKGLRIRRRLSRPPDRGKVQINALMKKGLRTRSLPVLSLYGLLVQINALMKKGLRIFEVKNTTFTIMACPNQCPDEEGIKNPEFSRPPRQHYQTGPNQCPDEEGIKKTQS